MTDERGSSPLALAIREVPGIAIASIDFGCALLAIEGDRLSTIRTVNISGDYHAVASLVSFLLLIMLALAYRKLDAPTHVPAAIVIGAGALMSASMFVVLQQSVWEDNPIVSSIARIVFGLGEGVILFLWMKALFPYGARACAAVLGLGTIVVAAMNSLIAFLKVDAAYGTVSLLPIVSMVLLCYFREYARSRAPRADRDDIPSEDACASPERSMVAGIGCPDRSLIVPSDQAPRGRRVFVVTMMLSLACYAVVFGHIHYQWIPLQDGGTVSLIIQLGTAVGTACGGAAILVLVQYFWNRRSLELYKVFLIPTVLLALWLSSFVNETWIFLYLVLLNITQKLVFLFIMLAPFLIESKRPYLMPWCVAFLSFTAGKAASSLLLEHMSPDVFVSSSVIALVVLFACGAITSLSGSITDYHTPIRGQWPGPDAPDVHDALPHANKLQNACHALTDQYQLTGREEEILVLLARGRTAQHIADTLVITQSTAKTHLRNIYAKMDVHNQQEILNLVEQTIDEQKKA